MNVLLTCAGRRNYLVQYFRDALAGRGLVVAADANLRAAALQEADRAAQLPPVSDPDYLRTLNDLCRAYRIDLAVPLNDLELPVMAAAREVLSEAGTCAVVSSPAIVSVCFDKWETFKWLRAHDLPAPATYNSLPSAKEALVAGELSFPLVVKPRWGSASIAVEFVEDAEGLQLAYRWVRRKIEASILAGPSRAEPDRAVLIQQRMAGTEFGLDVVNDLEGRHVATWVRQKLAMRAGETDRAVTVADRSLEALGSRLGNALGHVGNLDCDVMLAEGRPFILELNPRFGGGYPFSHLAGANLPAALLAWVRGEPPHPEWLRVRPGVCGAKCDRLVADATGG